MTRSELRAEQRRWRRGDLLAVVAAVVAGLALAWVMFAIRDLTDKLETANEARDALARQVEQLGATPVAGKPGSRGEPGRSIIGPKGDRGEPGPSGSPGEDGRAGDDGDDGAGGSPGPAGSPGADGVPGAGGPQGEPGPAGPQGEPGPAGQDGSDGKDGQTCPSGYSLQPPPDDPDALVCRRDSAPERKQGGGPLALALDPQRRQYT